ncbi:NUDIX domain-containing protein [Candidatus Dojkabacteria bacterium]|nr:NUDIX domain-containing protein [Candidatus Dojkabacteria bacterium]
MNNYLRYTQASVTNFLHYEDYYLFIKRKNNKRIDPGRLNGIGGRLEQGENYLDACIRETKEETGLNPNINDIKFSGLVRLQEGYSEDWIMGFFKIKVKSKKIPKKHTEDGKLVWIKKDKVLESKFELVDDLYYCFNDIVEGKSIFFISAILDENEKIKKIQKNLLPVY